MITRTQAQELAKVMRGFAAKYRAEGLRIWKGEEDMLEMILGDAKDYRKIAQLLRHNKISDAANLAGGLDTAAREEIPARVWDAIMEDND